MQQPLTRPPAEAKPRWLAAMGIEGRPLWGGLPALPSPGLLLSMLIALAVTLPIAYLLHEILTPDTALWAHMWDTFLPRMIKNTLVLTLGVGLGTFLVGVSSAWLVTAYEFPGRRWFEQALLLPLAVPSFIMGFVFIATFDFAGPVQTQYREWFGREAWFPDFRSPGGLILVMTLVLYPYVYLLARAAFREQAPSTFEAARVMGYSRRQTFLRLVLPLARPSLVAGVILAMMEAMTDYGTVSFFSYPTLSEGVVRVWEARFDRAGATQLAALLLLFAVGMIILERILRGQARYYQQRGRGYSLPRTVLHGWRRWVAPGMCSLLLSLAFVLPVLQLGSWAWQEYHRPTVGAWHDVYSDYIQNTVQLSGLAALVVMLLALAVVHGVRRTSLTQRRWLPRALTRLLTLGYAMPGAVIAVGVLLLVAPIDHQITDYLEQYLGRTDRSLIFTGTMTGLLYAYVVRFMAIGFNSVDASMEKVTPSMEEAARTMGARPWRILWRIHLPLMSTGVAAGAILVFVDVMKELPATLLLRPFGMDTLALWAYFLAMESFWQAAAIPALTILVVGLLPVFLLMRIGAAGEVRHSA